LANHGVRHDRAVPNVKLAAEAIDLDFVNPVSPLGDFGCCVGWQVSMKPG
jgi:hypothetical protein